MIRFLIAFISVWSFSTAAQAGVIYHWQELGTSKGGVSYAGHIEISDDAYFARVAQVGTAGSPCGVCPTPTDPSQSPVTTFSMRFTPATISFSANVVFAELFTFEIYAFDVRTDGVGLFGSIYANDTGSDISLASDRFGLWTIDQSNTDIGGACAQTGSPACQGATGRWVVDQSTVPIPEPAAFLLMLTMLGMMGCFQRQRRQPVTLSTQ